MSGIAFAKVVNQPGPLCEFDGLRFVSEKVGFGGGGFLCFVDESIKASFFGWVVQGPWLQDGLVLDHYFETMLMSKIEAIGWTPGEVEVLGGEIGEVRFGRRRRGPVSDPDGGLVVGRRRRLGETCGRSQTTEHDRDEKAVRKFHVPTLQASVPHDRNNDGYCSTQHTEGNGKQN
jgi:hypothetical protein